MNEAFWRELRGRMPASLAALFESPRHEVQVIATALRDDGETPAATAETTPLVTHRWGVVRERWFPAMSLVKLPMALLAAEALSAARLDWQTRVALDGPALSGEWPADEPAAESFARTLARLFAVSDNAAFNRLYDWLGPDAVHARLAALGYGAVRLVSRLGAPRGDGRATRGGALLAADGTRLVAWPARSAAERRFPYGRALAGSAWREDDGRVTPGPHDFSAANFLPLADAHTMLLALLVPAAVPAAHRWALTDAERAAFLAAMRLAPRDMADPRYDAALFPDDYARWLQPAALTAAGGRTVGKSGMAYGWLGDVRLLPGAADSGTQWLVSATVAVNADGVLNDDRYEYETEGIPFLRALGAAFGETA